MISRNGSQDELLKSDNGQNHNYLEVEYLWVYKIFKVTQLKLFLRNTIQFFKLNHFDMLQSSKKVTIIYSIYNIRLSVKMFTFYENND